MGPTLVTTMHVRIHVHYLHYLRSQRIGPLSLLFSGRPSFHPTVPTESFCFHCIAQSGLFLCCRPSLAKKRDKTRPTDCARLPFAACSHTRNSQFPIRNPQFQFQFQFQLQFQLQFQFPIRRPSQSVFVWRLASASAFRGVSPACVWSIFLILRQAQRSLCQTAAAVAATAAAHAAHPPQKAARPCLCLRKPNLLLFTYNTTTNRIPPPPPVQSTPVESTPTRQVTLSLSPTDGHGRWLDVPLHPLLFRHNLLLRFFSSGSPCRRAMNEASTL